MSSRRSLSSWRVLPTLPSLCVDLDELVKKNSRRGLLSRLADEEPVLIPSTVLLPSGSPLHVTISLDKTSVDLVGQVADVREHCGAAAGMWIKFGAQPRLEALFLSIEEATHQDEVTTQDLEPFWED